jgi:hypothetical protein
MSAKSARLLRLFKTNVMNVSSCACLRATRNASSAAQLLQLLRFALARAGTRWCIRRCQTTLEKGVFRERIDMRKNILISSAAVAALAFSGAAFAQGSPQSSPPRSPAANENATGTAPGLQNNRNEAPRATPGGERAQERTGTGTTTQSQSKPGASGSSTTTSQSDKSGAAGDRMTTGQTPKVQISEQQRTQLRSRFKEANIRTVSRDQINVSIAVGSVLPSTVTFVPIPDPILTIAPAFRGYHAVRVGDQILIVEPGTRRIVYIVEA